MVTKDIHLPSRYHQNIIETTQIMIAASAGSKLSKRRSKLILLMMSSIFPYAQTLLDFENACAYRSNFKVRAELIEILLKHESCVIGSNILETAIDIVNIRETVMYGTA